MTANAISSPTLKASAPLYQSLFVQVHAALLLGIVLGMAAPDFAVQLKLLSDGFLKLILMIVADSTGSSEWRHHGRHRHRPVTSPSACSFR